MPSGPPAHPKRKNHPLKLRFCPKNPPERKNRGLFLRSVEQYLASGTAFWCTNHHRLLKNLYLCNPKTVRTPDTPALVVEW